MNYIYVYARAYVIVTCHQKNIIYKLRNKMYLYVYCDLFLRKNIIRKKFNNKKMRSCISKITDNDFVVQLEILKEVVMYNYCK